MKRIASLAVAVLLLQMLLLPAIASAEQEPVNVVFIAPYSGTESDPEAYKMVQDYILQETGVLVDSIRLSGTNDNDKVNLMLSSDEQVDVFWGGWMTYATNGMIQPVTQYLDEVPNMLKVWTDFSPDALQVYTDSEGTVWGLPRNVNRVFYQTFVRQDWLDLLGMEGPATLDELNAFLYAVKEADPYGNGETIPLITRGDSLEALAYHFLGGFTQYGYSNWWNEETGTLMPYFLQDGYTGFLAQCAAWYNDGIIHKENFGWDTNTVRSLLASGRVAATGAYSTDTTAQYANLKVNYPGAVWYDDIEGMTGPNGDKMETQIKANSTAILFSAKSDEAHVKAALKVIDWMYSDWYNFKVGMSGIEGIHWEYNADYADAKEKHITSDLADASLYGKNFWFGIGLPLEMDCITYDADGQRNMHNEYMGHQGNTFAAKAPFDVNINYDVNALKDAATGYSDILTALNEEQVKFVTGQRDLSEWDTFVQELYDMGLQDYIDEYTRQYKAAVGME